MMRVALVLFVLLSPTAAAEPWLQYGYDAARTGATADPGPETFDVAFRVELNAPRPEAASPLIIGREALIVGMDANESVLYAVGLDTAVVGERIRFPGGPVSGIASDGERLFVARANDVAAYPIAGGEPAWVAPYPDLVPDASRRTRCVEPAVRDGILFLACTQAAAGRDVTFPWPLTQPHPTGAGVAFATAIEAATGVTRWTWDPRDDAARANEDPADQNIRPTAGSQATAAVALSVIGETVTVLLVESGEFTLAKLTPSQVWALDAATGEFRWVFSAAEDIYRSSLDVTTSPESASEAARLAIGTAPTGTPEITFLKFGSYLWAVSTLSGEKLWWRDVSSGDATGAPESSLAAHGGSVIAASVSSVHRIDIQTQTILWEAPLPEWVTDRIVVAGGHVYVRSLDQVVSVFDVDDGSVVTRLGEGGGGNFGGSTAIAVGEGVTVLATHEGNLTVLGHTAASITLDMRHDSIYPALGAEFIVDLAASARGAFGAPTEFRADWGDGLATEWQASPILAHSYDEAGDRVATFSARNPAGQSASQTMTIHVGATPETFLESAFSAENQERSFFILGLLVTLLFALLGFLRLQRRRGRLARELAAIDAAYNATRARPLDCEAALAERRARVRGLVLDGKLEENHLGIIERRLDELSAALRIETIDEKFGFLSVSMARTLREILADGRVSRVERQHLLSALEHDTILSSEQKEKVRALIDEWFHRDRGGAPEGAA